MLWTQKQDNAGATLHGIINYLSGENALLKNIFSGKERVALGMKKSSYLHLLKMRVSVRHGDWYENDS